MYKQKEHMKELEIEIIRLKKELETTRKREKDLNDTRKAMLYMLEELHESNAMIERAKMEWEATFDAISDPIFIHDRTFKIVRANKAYAEAAGVPLGDLVGKPYYEIFPGMDGPLKSCLRSGKTLGNGIEEILRISPEKIFNVRSYYIRDINGESLYSIHTMKDITERIKAEEKIQEETEINRVLLKVAEVIGMIVDKNEMLRKVVEIIPRVVKADRCAIFFA